MNAKKTIEFAIVLENALLESINEEESIHHIEGEDIEEFTTEFIAAIACIVPAKIFQKLTGEDVNNIDFNHIANKLCFQLSNAIKELPKDN